MRNKYTQTQRAYLTAMGIVSWNLLDHNQPINVSNSSFHPLYIVALKKENGLSGIIFADADEDLSQRESEKNLLLAFSKALGIPLPKLLLVSNQAEFNPNLEQDKQFVICLGVKSAINFLDESLIPETTPQLVLIQDIPHLFHYSLKTLIQNPLLKAELWRDVGKVRERCQVLNSELI